MVLSQLGYEKADGNRIISSDSVSSVEMPHSTEREMSNAETYSKAEPYRSVAILFIISGGEDRESKYFEPLRRDPILKRHIQVSFETKKNQGYPPYEMAEIARTFSANNEFVISDTGERFQLLPEDTIMKRLQVINLGGPLSESMTSTVWSLRCHKHQMSRL